MKMIITFGGIDLSRDVKNIKFEDLRIVKSGEHCQTCNYQNRVSKLEVFTAIELGHIFKLGTKYSVSMGANFLDENGKENPLIMGSYGIGVERVLACYLEQHHDENGIVWEKTLAPFQIHILGLNMKNEKVTSTSEKLYDELKKDGYEVLFDERQDAQAGVKFNDADLLGMPVQIIVGDRKLKENKVEIKVRSTGERMDIGLDDLKGKLKEILK